VGIGAGLSASDASGVERCTHLQVLLFLLLVEHGDIERARGGVELQVGAAEVK